MADETKPDELTDDEKRWLKLVTNASKEGYLLGRKQEREEQEAADAAAKKLADDEAAKNPPKRKSSIPFLR